MTYSPAISLVPRPLMGVNLRKVLTQTQWKNLRASIIEERGLRCETCGKEEQESKKIQAHEEWRYDTSVTPAVAHLEKIKLSCWHCHAVEHFGVTGRLGLSGQLEIAIDDTINHFCRLNNVTPDEFMSYAHERFKYHDEISHLEWDIDWGEFAPMVEARLST